MTPLPRDLRFYTFAIPITLLAGWGFADSLNNYHNYNKLKNYYVQNFLKTPSNTTRSHPSIGYDGLVLRSNQNQNQNQKEK